MDSNDVIVVDADVARREALADVLRRRGDRVILAEDGKTAAEAVDGSGARLLVIDLGLPGLDRDALRNALDPSDEGRLHTLDVVERDHIGLVLLHTGGNRSRAAKLLGISRSTLLAKIRRYGLT